MAVSKLVRSPIAAEMPPRAQSVSPAHRRSAAHSASPAHNGSPDARATTFVDLLSEALADERTAERLAFADAVVQVNLIDAPDSVITLLFDRSPAAVTLGASEQPEIRLWMSCQDLDLLANEGVFLPIKITTGEVRFDGCVRKFLRVLPILRRALGDTLAQQAA
jgi:hypothetical protein